MSLLQYPKGLERLAILELNRVHPASPEEAHKFLAGKLGAYDTDGRAIRKGVKLYFNEQNGLPN